MWKNKENNMFLRPKSSSLRNFIRWTFTWRLLKEVVMTLSFFFTRGSLFTKGGLNIICVPSPYTHTHTFHITVAVSLVQSLRMSLCGFFFTSLLIFSAHFLQTCGEWDRRSERERFNLISRYTCFSFPPFVLTMCK